MCSSDNLVSPVNITKSNVVSDCNIKCSLDTNYNNSYVNVHNKGHYISLDYQANSGSNNSNYHITLNKTKLMVSEIRLYFPSIHSYNDKKADGEMLIIHSGNGSNCIISIPIQSKSETTIGENTLSAIINSASLTVPNKNESSTLNITNFNLSDIVPTNTPYYFYNGQLIFDPCSQKYNYIVFDKGDYSININNKTLDKIKKILKSPSGNISQSKNIKILNFNKQGATNVNLNGTDDIYIECKPVSSTGSNSTDETTELPQISEPTSDKTERTQKITLETLSKNPAFDVVVSFVGLFILYTTGKYVLSYIKKNK